MKKLGLYVREVSGGVVTVADVITGFAVAQFYNQAGMDGKDMYDAAGMAERFVEMVNEGEGEEHD